MPSGTLSSMSALCVQACEEAGWLGEVAVFLLIAGRALWTEKQKRDLAAKNVQLKSERAGLQATVQALTQRPTALRVPTVPQGVELGGLPPSPRPSTALQTDETPVLIDERTECDRGPSK